MTRNVCQFGWNRNGTPRRAISKAFMKNLRFEWAYAGPEEIRAKGVTAGQAETILTCPEHGIRVTADYLNAWCADRRIPSVKMPGPRGVFLIHPRHVEQFAELIEKSSGPGPADSGARTAAAAETSDVPQTAGGTAGDGAKLDRIIGIISSIDAKLDRIVEMMPNQGRLF